ncbi:hypothetical protein BKI49_31535 [Streptomyces sp. Tue6028]|nr:hypothetical protein BKI49_31535 [Streptomyces sp. Tue6028]
MRDVYIVDAVRTPIGRYNGSLAPVRPDDLAAHAIRKLLIRTPRLDPARIEDVYFGNANGGTGVATLCIGVGQGLALVLER